jgi:hypothetical protein
MNVNVAVSLVICAIVLISGLIFTLFPRWGMKLVCRCARSYMSEDLSSDELYVMSFRIYGIAAMGLGFYALFQVVQFMKIHP